MRAVFLNVILILALAAAAARADHEFDSRDIAAGARLYAEHCAACHGDNAAGRDGAGPPLVHKIYEPNHHSDAAFFLAARQGVRSHHWPFGNMPPVAGVSDDEVALIVAYVRELQRANGVF